MHTRGPVGERRPRAGAGERRKASAVDEQGCRTLDGHPAVSPGDGGGGNALADLAERRHSQAQHFFSLIPKPKLVVLL